MTEQNEAVCVDGCGEGGGAPGGRPGTAAGPRRRGASLWGSRPQAFGRLGTGSAGLRGERLLFRLPAAGRCWLPTPGMRGRQEPPGVGGDTPGVRACPVRGTVFGFSSLPRGPPGREVMGVGLGAEPWGPWMRATRTACEMIRRLASATFESARRAFSEGQAWRQCPTGSGPSRRLNPRHAPPGARGPACQLRLREPWFAVGHLPTGKPAEVGACQGQGKEPPG